MNTVCTSSFRLLMVTVILAAATVVAAAPLVGTLTDRDGDGRVGEATAIQERAAAYHQRRSDARLSSAELLARARFGYAAWREEQAKGVEGDGWISLGPDNGAGRVVAVVPHPFTTGELLAGAAGGGLWRSRDNGTTWVPLTDGIADLSVGAAAYAPENPEVIYLGTGEGGYAVDFIPGIGLLRSDDGGDTWFLPQGEEDILASQFFDLEVVHPAGGDVLDPSTYVVHAATNLGLFRSTDGGETWATSIPGSGLVGVSELVRPDPDGTPDLVFAALWCTSACPVGLGRVVRSDDGGLTWAAAASGLPGTSNATSSLNRNALAATRDGRTLYLGLNLPSSDSTRSAIYRSDDGGASWTATADAGDYLGEQGWYDNVITVHPDDPNVVVAGGVWYVRSSDGGATWRDVPDAVMPHVDAHAFAWRGDELWTGCDGGVWLSLDRGETWVDRNDTLVTRQFYGMALDPIRRERVIGGTQDNSTNLRHGADEGWEVVIGGDGFECAVNSYASDIMYGTVQYGAVYRSLDGFTSSIEDVTPDYGDDETPFLSLLTMRPDQPWVLYASGTKVWRTTDAGDSWSELPTTVAGFGWSTGVVRSIAVTPADDQLLAVAKGPVVYVSHDDGHSWRGAVVGLTVNHLDISPLDPDQMLAATVSSPAGTMGVRRSTDGGATWLTSGAGLPPFAVQVVRWDPTDAAVAYAGTDVGLYRSSDGGASWARFGDGLPAASVHDLRILADGSMLRLATHGRGIWELAVDNPSNQSPVIAITSHGDTLEAFAGSEVTLAATATDADGDPLTVTWMVGGDWRLVDGGSGIGSLTSTPTLTLDTAGRYPIVAHVADAKGGADFAMIAARVTEGADDCATARVIPPRGPFPVTVVTSNATATTATSDPTPSCTFPPGTGRFGTVWFAFTPAESNRYVVSTCGSSFDTVLTAVTGDACGPFTELGCSYVAPAGSCSEGDGSYLELDLAAGATYRFMVGSWGTSRSGGFQLNVACATCATVIPGRQYLVAAAANAEGDSGTRWLSDLNLYNPGPVEVTAELAFLPGGSDNSAVSGPTVTVAAGAAREDRDVVGELLAATGPGAIRIIASDQLLIASRTYNDTADGSFGQLIPGTEHLLAAGASARLIGLAANAAYRTNLGLANGSAVTATATVDLVTSDGTVADSRDEVVPPFGWLQVNRILERAGLSDVSSVTALVHNSSEAAEVAVYASVVDEVTGDPTYVTSPRVATPDAPLWLVGAAHVDGVGDSVWRTDLELANLSDETVRVSLKLVLEGRPADPADPYLAMDLSPHQSRRVDDVLYLLAETLWGLSGGVGSVGVCVDAGEVAATSRTYNQTDHGTFGQLVPGLPASAAAGVGQRAILTGLRHDPTFFRTNVGVANLSDQPITVDAVYSDPDGAVLGAATYELAPWEYDQVNSAVPGAGTAGGFAVLTTTTPGARFLAYASVVDRGTDDPVYIPAEVLSE